jgi:hypothetical protein
VDLIVCTDAEEILGIGDWGVNGVDISIGKLAISTAAAGINPGRVIAVSLDCGTNNAELLNDPTYLGNRHARLGGDQYEEFIATYLETAAELFPKAILHFEDFGPENARRILGPVPRRLPHLHGYLTSKARPAALRQLVLQAPAPVIARSLGFHDLSTTRIAAEAGGTWNRYAPGNHTR